MSAAALRVELAQAQAELERLRLLVSERRASGAALCVAEYRAAGLRRRLADLATDPPATGRGGITHRDPA